MRKRALLISSILVLGLIAACSSLAPISSIQSLERVNQQLELISDKSDYHAFITVNNDGARRDAQRALGQLQGMTLAVKDNIDVAGLPTTAGSKGLMQHIARSDASAIERLKSAGAVIIGKTNMHELAFGITSNNATFGAVKNAVNPDYLPGGSSGGTGVAVALGLADAGLGTDTGGSSRIPAALNGIVGFRPSTGRYPSDGMLRISNTRDTIGPMATSVATIALLDSVMNSSPNQLPTIRLNTLRIGVPKSYFYDNLDPATSEVANAVLSKLEKHGVTLVVADLEGVPELNEKIGFPVVFYETPAMVSDYLEQSGSGLTIEQVQAQIESPDVKGVIDTIMKRPIPKEAYDNAVGVLRPQLQALYAEYFKRHNVDAVIYPTTPLPARPRANSDETVLLNGNRVPTFPTYIRNVDPSSNAGIPSITLPAGLSPEGLPIGVALDGPINQDRLLLSIATSLESLLKQ